MALKPDPHAYPPRGMSREDAAHYIGVGTTKFDEMVADRRMPKPRQIDGRKVWDRVALDIAFTHMPGGEQSETERILEKALGARPKT